MWNETRSLAGPRGPLSTFIASQDNSDLLSLNLHSQHYLLGRGRGEYNLHVTSCEERLLNNKGLRDKQPSLVAIHGVQNLSAEHLKVLGWVFFVFFFKSF